MNAVGSRRAGAASAALVLLSLAASCSSDGGEAPSPPDGTGGFRPEPDGGPPGSTGGTRAGDAAAAGGASGSGGSAGSAGDDAGAPSTGGVAERPDTGVPSPESGTGVGPLVCDGPGARFATSVVAHEFGPGQNVGQEVFPAPIFGPPQGAGARNGSIEGVVSLGNGGTVTVAFDGNGIADEPGPDFIVFENAFWVNGNPEQPFAELGTVAVSDDGVTWHEFPCTATEAPYGHCSGWRPVFANPENDLDPLDPAVAGGDPYDLSDIGVARARFVRVTDRADLTGTAGVYDLDAVGIIHGVCP